jgi:hypothetical protein
LSASFVGPLLSGATGGQASTVTRFASFSIEISGAWGPASQRFHKEVLAHVNNAFDIEYFH